MNDSAAQSPHPSALENVLREALLAHPDICHTKLTSFWEQSGESSLELDRFKHIWSKAHVSSRVFGQARGIDIEKLSQSLVHEGGDLFRGTAPRARLAKKRASAAAGPSSGSAAQSSALLGELDGYRRDLRRLDAALHQVGRGVEQAKESEKQTSVALLDTRRSLRGVKLAWSGGRKEPSSAFRPFDMKHFNSAEIIYGVGQPKHDIVTLKTTAVMGIKLSSEKPLMQSSAWKLFSELVILSAAQDGALTPFPIAAYREGGAASSPSYCLFVFENPGCVALKSLFGKRLAMGLRRNPSIIILWASQLGKMYSAVSQREDLDIFQRPFAMCDIFVREDGRLILGNLQSSSYRRIATYTNSDSFCQFTVQLLKTVLCISRKEYISLKANDRLSRPEKFVSEHVLSVTEGSSLSLIFFDCPKYCKDIDLDCSDTEFRKKDSSSNICVRIVSDSESTNVPAESVHKLDTPIIRLVLMDEVELNADIQHRSNVCRRVLRIEAVSVGCGIIGISVPAFLNENSKTADVVVFLKIYVVPRVPVENTMAHELLGLLECVPNFPNSLEHARCVMRAQCMSRLDITYENLEQGLADEAMSQASSLRKTLNQQWAAILNSALSTIHDHADHSSISHLNDKSTAKIRSSMDPQKSMSGNSASNSKVTSSLFENHDDSGQIYRYGGKDSGDDSFAMLWR